MASYLYFLVFFVLKFTTTSVTDFDSNWFYDDGVAYSSNFTLYATTIKNRGVWTSNGNNKNVGHPENISAANRKENNHMDFIYTPSPSPSSLPKVPIFNGHQKKDQFFLKNLQNKSKHEYHNESLSLSLDQVKPFNVSSVLLPLRLAADVVVLEADVMSGGRSLRSDFTMSRESWGIALEAQRPKLTVLKSTMANHICTPPLLPTGGARSVLQISNIMTKTIVVPLVTVELFGKSSGSSMVLALDGITPKHSQPYKLTTVQDSILNSKGFHPLTIRRAGVPNDLDLRPNLHEVKLCVHFYTL
ncbi:hypothetical protein TIFTF001_045398 [Ficus carica]|uniref:Uncharacterized protein n=1 Tax=Ficus carica TaxID=3494 RepID=A0AA88CKA2_FICCA|nr:hypothetical protein TIFTF001_045398 [Ficus carica]